MNCPVDVNTACREIVWYCEGILRVEFHVRGFAIDNYIVVCLWICGLCSHTAADKQ